MHVYISEALKSFGCRILENEDMSRHTSFGTGGKADILCISSDRESARNAYKFLYGSNVPFRVLGRCSNILVSDKGYRGVLLKFYGDTFAENSGDGIMLCSGGTSAKKAADFAMENGLSGAEFMGTVPSSMGGLVCMNAGCFGREMKDIVYRAEGIIENEDFSFGNEGCKFSYRNSLFCEKKCIILNIALKLEPGYSKETILGNTKDILQKRRESQPVSLPSAGSVFKRQGDIIPAKLIDSAGLKGYRVGGAEVSPKHAGFIVNTGGATSQDIYNLIQQVKIAVYDRFEVSLIEEILYIGEF